MSAGGRVALAVLCLAAPILMYAAGKSLPVVLALVVAVSTGALGVVAAARFVGRVPGIVAALAVTAILIAALPLAGVDAWRVPLAYAFACVGLAWLASSPFAHSPIAQTANEISTSRSAPALPPADAGTTPRPSSTHPGTEEFLGILAHELRNPLAPLRTAVQLLRMPGVTGTRANEMLDVADRQVTEMVHIIDALSEYSRSARGKLELYREHLDLAALLDDAMGQSRAERERLSQEADVTVEPGAMPVHGDATRLVQAIVQVLTNASRFSPTGARIAVSLRRDGDVGEIRIRDAGVGAASDALARVFDPFVRTPPPEGRPPGLGLGLTLAKHAFALHGATIEARSAGPGQGTEVEIRVPLERAD
jgi:signal transduction histidine kinase